MIHRRICPALCLPALLCSAVAVAIIVVVGTPAAYLLTTRRFRGRAAIVTLVELPLVLPPAVAGIGLLAALGPNGVLGGWLQDAGIQLVLTTTGVVVALTFVAAPFYRHREGGRHPPAAPVIAPPADRERWAAGSAG